MQYLKLATLLLTSSLLYGIKTEKPVTVKDRIVNAKDRAVSRMSAWLVLWSGTTKEDQLKRLSYYQSLVEGLKNRRFLKRWQLYKKRWYPWIIDGKMPIKNPDGRMADEEFLRYAVAVHELVTGSSLNQDEIEAICQQELQEIEQYRKDKGIAS